MARARVPPEQPDGYHRTAVRRTLGQAISDGTRSRVIHRRTNSAKLCNNVTKRVVCTPGLGFACLFKTSPSTTHASRRDMQVPLTGHSTVYLQNHAIGCRLRTGTEQKSAVRLVRGRLCGGCAWSVSYL